MSIHEALKRRRHDLGFTQSQIADRVGMSRQQYQRLERGGNPRLDTLQLAADGLNTRLMLIPVEQWYRVKALLEEGQEETVPLDEDPWQGLLDEES